VSSGFRWRQTGVLAPGDPPPPPGSQGHLDYRGALDARAFKRRDAGPFSLGRVVNLRAGKPARNVGLYIGEIAHHAVVVGPPGSGKTHGVIIPWIVAALRGGASVIALDVKGDMLSSIDAHRRRFPPIGCRVVNIDYTRPDRSASWNWVSELRSPSGGPNVRAVSSAVEAILGKERPHDSQPFFHQQDSMILQSLLELVCHSSRQNVTAAQLLALLSDQLELESVVNKYCGTPPAARLEPYVVLGPSDYAKATSGVRVVLTDLAQPLIEKISTHQSVSSRELIDDHYLTVMVAPVQDGKLSAAISALFLGRLSQAIYDRLSTGGGRPVVLVIDEAARILDRVRIEEFISVARSADACVVLALQDAAQIKDENERSTILSNCSTYVSLHGVSRASADYLSSRLGDNRVSSYSSQSTRNPGRWSRTESTSMTSEQAPVLGPREIMAPPFGHRSAIVHARDVSDRPFVVDLSRLD